MKVAILAGAMATAFVCSGDVSAGAIEDELAAIKARIAQLEKMVQEQNEVIKENKRVISEKDRQIQELVSNPRIREQMEGTGVKWTDRITVSGGIEVEASYNDPDEGDSSSDLVVAEATFGIAAQINDWVAGEITLLYEEDDTDLEVDVATVTIDQPDAPWFVVAGQHYVPFGTYKTQLVSDPLTLEIGETRETTVFGGVRVEGITAGVYAFNGDLDEDGDDDIDAFGAVVGYSQATENISFGGQVSYISDIGDSDGLQDTVNDNLNDAMTDYDDQVAGVAVDATFTTGPFTLIAEYVTATDSFHEDELAFDGGGAEPSAFNIEAGYSFTIAGKNATAAIAYQGTDEAVALDLPEERIAVGLSIEVMKNTTLSFEWAHDDDYSSSDGGTGENGGDTATAQLAVGF